MPEQITRADWVAFAKDLGMPPKRLLERLEELATYLPDVAGNAVQSFSEVHGIEVVYDKLEESVRRRCRWTLNSVFGIKTVI